MGKILDIIRKKKKSNLDELRKAGKELLEKENVLDRKEQSLLADKRELELEVAIDGEDDGKLREIQEELQLVAGQRQALQEAYQEVVGQVLELMPQEKEKYLQKLDREQGTLRKVKEDNLVALLRCAAEMACLLHALEGIKADSWDSFLLPSATHSALQGIIGSNRDAFKAELQKAKGKVAVFKKVGNIKVQINAIKNERSKLQMRTFDQRDAEDFIQSGRLSIEPAEPARPIRPRVPSMVT